MLYHALFQLILKRLPAEDVHRVAAFTLRWATASAAVRRRLRQRTLAGRGRLEVQVLGRTFPTPLGASAGVDKNATWFDALGAIGFGFVEVGTITPTPQQANPGRTVLRAPADHALLNRMGFPNVGAKVAGARLRRRSRETIVGVNIGKARATPLEAAGADYQACLRELAPLADYLVINVSSPNTEGLRDMQATARLRPLITAVQEQLAAMSLRIPLLVKISPDLSDAELDAIADLAVDTALDGIVAVNTTTDRSGLSTDQSGWFDGGGISGAPLKARALSVLERLYGRVGGQLTLISVGGIENADDAWQRILAGASLIQGYTGFIYGGPAWPRQINRELARRVEAAGVTSIQALVGAGSRAAGAPPDITGEETPAARRVADQAGGI